MPNQNFDLVSNPNNLRIFQGPYGAGHAVSVNRSTPTIPSNQRGVGGAFNSLMVDQIAFECAGYGADATVRARLWNSSGTALARSAAVVINGVTTSTLNVPLNVFDLTSPVVLTGNELHRWGLWSTQAIAMQRVSDSTFNIWTDISIGAADNWSTGNTDVHASGANSGFVGYFRYFLMPTPPSINTGSMSSGSSSISFSWVAPTDDGGKAVSAYVVEYKPSFSSTWTIHDSNYTSTSVTISSLSSSTTYNIRVAAKNEVATLVGTTSDYSTASITTQAGATPPPPPPPPPASVSVPNLNGLTLSQANSALSNAGLNSSPSPQTSGATSSNNNLVIDNTQSPAAGTLVNSGSSVSFSYYSFIAPSQKVSVWNGTSWVVSTPKIWNGTSWVDPAVIRIWNGTSWVEPT